MLKIYGRLLLFFGYTSLFMMVPLALFGGGFWAILVGIVFNFLFLWIISQKGRDKVLQLLQARTLVEEHYPGVYQITRFYSAKLHVSPPTLMITSIPSANLAAFGVSRESSALIVSEELLTSLTREELGSLICRAVTSIASRQTQATTWLSYFLSFLERLAPNPTSKLITYPLAFFPIRILSKVYSEQQLDSQSLDFSLSPKSLLHALQSIRNQVGRSSWPAPASLSILFLLPPTATDPLAQVLWLPDDSKHRILLLKEAFYHS